MPGGQTPSSHGASPCPHKVALQKALPEPKQKAKPTPQSNEAGAQLRLPRALQEEARPSLLDAFDSRLQAQAPRQARTTALKRKKDSGQTTRRSLPFPSPRSGRRGMREPKPPRASSLAEDGQAALQKQGPLRRPPPWPLLRSTKGCNQTGPRAPPRRDARFQEE
jgi:hypothetical protein